MAILSQVKTPGNPLKDPGWQHFATDLAKKLGVHPNYLYWNPDEKSLALVAFRGSHDSWSLNEAGVVYVRDAVRDGRIAQGFVLLAKRPNEIASVMDIENVFARLNLVPCRDGKFGRYRWVNEGFTTDATADLAEAPF